MIAVAVLGELLDAAYEHFAAVGSAVRDGLWDRVGAARELGRLAGTMTRYLDIVTRPEAAIGDDVSGWELSAAYMREGARTAETCLVSAAGSAAAGLPPVSDPAVRELGLAVDALIAGGDLLWSHVSIDQEGHRVPRSDWTRLLRTEPFTLAATDEIAGWSRRAVQILDHLTDAPGQLQGVSVSALRGARGLLSAAAGVDRRAGSADYDMVSRRELLRMLPLSAPPGRVPPESGESDTDLCAGITFSAQRLRVAAFAASRLPGDSPRLTRDTWMATAHASAVISDIACGITGMLADRSASLGLLAAAEAGLRTASVAFTHACTAWRQVTGMWKIIRTDTQFPSSPSPTEVGDLVLRMGRLLHDDPAWTPAARRGAVAREPGSLAGSRPELVRALAAVHEAADAVTRSAISDLDGIVAAHDADRLYMSSRYAAENTTTRLLYVPLAGYRAHLLMNAYHIGINASLRAATALDSVALATNAPSKVLSLIRTATAGDRRAPEPGYELDPGTFTGQKLPHFGRPARSPLRPYKELDADAVLRAYKDSGLSMSQCADRFTASASAIGSVLAFNGVKPRFRWEPDDSEIALKANEPADQEPLPTSNNDAPVTGMLNELGVDDIGIRMRAAAIDKAAADLIHQATASAPPPAGSAARSPARKRTAAQLAALDGPRDANLAVQPAVSANRGGQEPGQPRQRSQDVPRPRPRRA